MRHRQRDGLLRPSHTSEAAVAARPRGGVPRPAAAQHHGAGRDPRHVFAPGGHRQRISGPLPMALRGRQHTRTGLRHPRRRACQRAQRAPDAGAARRRRWLERPHARLRPDGRGGAGGRGAADADRAERQQGLGAGAQLPRPGDGLRQRDLPPICGVPTLHHRRREARRRRLSQPLPRALPQDDTPAAAAVRRRSDHRRPPPHHARPHRPVPTARQPRGVATLGCGARPGRPGHRAGTRQAMREGHVGSRQ